MQVGPDAPPYANNTILSPHVYPTSVIPRGCTGKGLCNRLSNSWGHLQLKARLFRGSGFLSMLCRQQTLAGQGFRCGTLGVLFHPCCLTLLFHHST